MISISLEKQIEYRKKWVEALRSGKYKQIKGSLRAGEGFCCLGVLCDLAKDEIGGQWGAPSAGQCDNHDAQAFVLPSEEGEDQEEHYIELPYRICDLVGLRTVSGVFGTSGLVVENDDNNKSFQEIADIIESAPEGLFVEARP